MDLKVALIDLCECGKTRKNSEWKHRDLKKLMQDARVGGFTIKFKDDKRCPECSGLLPVPTDKSPMSVFIKVHQLSLQIIQVP